MKFLKIEVCISHNYKLLYQIFKAPGEYIVHDYYLHKIHCVASVLDIFPILNDCLLLDKAVVTDIGKALARLERGE